MVSCRLLISQSESRISSDTDLSEIMSNNVSVDPDTKPQDEPQFIVFCGMLMGLFKMFCFQYKEDNPTVTI